MDHISGRERFIGPVAVLASVPSGTLLDYLSPAVIIWARAVEDLLIILDHRYIAIEENHMIIFLICVI